MHAAGTPTARCLSDPAACLWGAPPLSHCQLMHAHTHAHTLRAQALLTPMHQMGMLFLTELQVLTGAENALSPIGLLQQYTRAPNGQHTTAVTAPTTKPSVGPKTLHLQQQEGSTRSRRNRGGPIKGSRAAHRAGERGFVGCQSSKRLGAGVSCAGVREGVLLQLRTPAWLPWSCDSITPPGLTPPPVLKTTCRGCCCLSRCTSS